MTEPVLSIRNLTKRFGGLVAVNDLSWDVYPGEVVALLGDNGAGKSTLIKCVSGVYQPDDGEIRFEGRLSHFARPMDARRQGIETIYQDLALANNLDVGANIFLGREVKKRYLGGLIRTLDEQMMLRESQAALESLAIQFPSLTQPIESLSGGQRQAVAIARAVYWDARLMIMDEPTNNLGVPEQHKVLELIRKLRDQGVPVILITHTLSGRLRGLGPPHGDAQGTQGDGEADGGDAYPGACAIHGGRPGRYARGIDGAGVLEEILTAKSIVAFWSKWTTVPFERHSINQTGGFVYLVETPKVGRSRTVRRASCAHLVLALMDPRRTPRASASGQTSPYAFANERPQRDRCCHSSRRWERARCAKSSHLRRQPNRSGCSIRLVPPAVAQKVRLRAGASPGAPRSW